MELLLATVAANKQPWASCGPWVSSWDTSTLSTVVTVVTPSVTEISMLSSAAADPSCTYCRAFRVTSS